jgi:hypothetical protein
LFPKDSNLCRQGGYSMTKISLETFPWISRMVLNPAVENECSDVIEWMGIAMVHADSVRGIL